MLCVSDFQEGMLNTSAEKRGADRRGREIHKIVKTTRREGSGVPKAPTAG